MNKQQMPKLGNGERVVQVDIEVPDALFQPKPVPKVTLTVANPYEGDGTEIVVSEAQPQSRGLSEQGQAQQKVNRAAARLLERGLRSKDPEIQGEALQILNALQSEGIKVEIAAPELEEIEA